MRTSFPGYYTPTNDEFLDIWNNCIFILDANVLLNMYRYTPDTRDELIRILESISDRIWLPHQAALEYHSNRLNVILAQFKAYEKLQNEIKEYQNKLETLFNSIAGRNRHPYIDSVILSNKITRAFNEILKELSDLKNSHPDFLNEDPILDTITNLFNGKVGEPYSDEKLIQIYRDGKNRFDKKVPPGYKDQDKGDLSQFGDLILWFQVIDFAKENNIPIILITDDRKDDWWLKIEGKTVGPLPELINEIMFKSNSSFYMYSADPFMSKAREYLNREVNQRAIEEIQEIRKQDEIYFSELNDVFETTKSYLEQHDLFAKARAAVIEQDKLLAQMRVAAVPNELFLQAKEAAIAQENLLAQIRATSKFDENLEKIKAAFVDNALFSEAVAAANYQSNFLSSIRANAAIRDELLSHNKFSSEFDSSNESDDPSTDESNEENEIASSEIQD